MRLVGSLGVAVLTMGLVASPVTSQAATAGAHASRRPKGLPPVNGRQAARVQSHFGPAAVSYMYVSGYQNATAAGATVTLKQAQPHVASGDYHSLAEMAAESADGSQIVEVGWTVDPGLNGDTLPHLFVFHWVDGDPTCYNGCGFVQVSATVHPGDPVAAGTSAAYQLSFANKRWWVYYNHQKVGYFPGSLWQGRYKQLGLVQVFGEVSISSASPCTDMGNGIFGSAPHSATISKFALVGSASASALTVFATNPGFYNQGAVKPLSFRFGGPGAC